MTELNDKAVEAVARQLEQMCFELNRYHEQGMTNSPEGWRVDAKKVIEAYEAAKGDGWLPKEQFQEEGAQVIAWLSSNKGFQDCTANLIYLSGRWNWGDDDESPVKRQDLIKGVIPYPQPPKSEV
jgi:hypothetical protein